MVNGVTYSQFEGIKLANQLSQTMVAWLQDGVVSEPKPKPGATMFPKDETIYVKVEGSLVPSDVAMHLQMLREADWCIFCNYSPCTIDRTGSQNIPVVANRMVKAGKSNREARNFCIKEYVGYIDSICAVKRIGSVPDCILNAVYQWYPVEPDPEPDGEDSEELDKDGEDSEELDKDGEELDHEGEEMALSAGEVIEQEHFRRLKRQMIKQDSEMMEAWESHNKDTAAAIRSGIADGLASGILSDTDDE